MSRIFSSAEPGPQLTWTAMNPNHPNAGHPLSSTKNLAYHNDYAYRDRVSVTSRVSDIASTWLQK